MHKEHINFTPSLIHSGTPKETSRFSWQCEVMICFVKFAYSVEFDAFGGESKKVATLPAPSGNTPDIEWMQPRSLLFSAKVKENCLSNSMTTTLTSGLTLMMLLWSHANGLHTAAFCSFIHKVCAQCQQTGDCLDSPIA